MPRHEGELIGHTTCPECDFPNAEVRRDRSGHPYRVCTRCKPASVYFTLGYPKKVDRLLARTRRSSLLSVSS